KMVQYLNTNSGFNQWNATHTEPHKKSSFGKFLWWSLLFLMVWWLLGSWFNTKNTTNTNEVPNQTPELDLSSVPTTDIDSAKITGTIQGLRISNVKLNDYYVSSSDKTPVSVMGDNGYIEVGLTTTGTTAPVATTVWKIDGDKYTWRNGDGVVFTRNIVVQDYLITITDNIENKSGHDYGFAPYVNIERGRDEKSSAGVYTGSVAYVNSDLEHRDWTRLDKQSYAYSTTNGFVGFADQYWETIAAIDSPDQTMRVKKSGDLYSASSNAGVVNIPVGQSKEITTSIYTGPRDTDILKSVETAIPGIQDTVDYGWFWFLAQPMLWALNHLNSVVMNYGIAIIILTIFVRLLMWPLTRKSYTSMIAMQKMQPELQRVQKLYANDKARLQMEMLKIYQTHKTSPMSGCLPMLIQIPIFFALYKALLISVQMRSAQFLWISDLAVMDPYYILPILMGATMWLQQYLQTGRQKNKETSANDIAAQTNKIMKWMPILFVVMFAWMPAGLVLYWTVSNIFGIVQMWIIKRNTK
ncbi:MAG: membrane protein insertase YidC, partial [Alphaproteobacteria bacterium]